MMARIRAIAILSMCLISAMPISAQAKSIPFLSYQDSIGQYSFGYSDPNSARSEYRASDGVTRGTYSYVDRNGLIQTAEYEAGKDLGFRVRASNLPQAPLPIADTPEVLAAREMHLQMLEEARIREDKMNQEARNSGSKIESEAQADEKGAEEVKDNDASRMTMTEARNIVNSPSIESEAAGSGGDDRRVQAETKGNEAAVKNAVVPEHREDSVAIMRSTLPVHVAPKPEQNIHIETRVNIRPSIHAAIPHPVDFTPEVLAAREAHFRAYETAAKLAAEADANPQVLEQLLRGQAIHDRERMAMADAQMFEHKATMNADGADFRKQISYPATITAVLNVKAADRRMEATVVEEGEKMDKMTEKMMEQTRPMEMPQKMEMQKLGTGLTPASTSLRVMDVRFPSLNEFQQTKLKAGAYNTPIEISHLSLPKYQPFIGGSAFYFYF